MATPLIHRRYVKAPISLPQVDLERANGQGNPEHRPGGHFNCRHENLIVIDNGHIIPSISKNMGIKWDNLLGIKPYKYSIIWLVVDLPL